MSAQLRLADAPDVMTVSEVANCLRIGRNAAYELVASGAIYGAKCGRSIRVPRTALEAFLRINPDERDYIDS